MFKKIFVLLTFLIILISSSVPVFAAKSNKKKSEEDLKKEAILNLDDDNLDDIFSEGEEGDIVVEQAENVDGTKKTGLDKILSEKFFIPLRFSGKLDTSLGIFYSGDFYTNDHKFSGYFTFSNDLYLTCRLDKSLAFRGVINTTFPPFNETTLKFKEIYVDYLMFDLIYLTLGKKATTWGYPRVFSSGENYKCETVLTDSDIHSAILSVEKEGFLHTNILYNTQEAVSAMIRIPVWTGMISGLAYYTKSLVNPTFEDLFIAGSVEMTVFHTTVNIFGKKSQHVSRDDDDVKGDETTYMNKKRMYLPMLGVEAKRTILGFDVYAQDIIKLEDWRSFKPYINSVTAGFYKLWDNFTPNLGLSFEFQNAINFIEHAVHNRYCLELGVKRLGKNGDMKVAVRWTNNHIDQIIASSNDSVETINKIMKGNIKLIFIKSGIWSHCDWENVFEFNYNDFTGEKNIKFVTSLKIQADY